MSDEEEAEVPPFTPHMIGRVPGASRVVKVYSEHYAASWRVHVPVAETARQLAALLRVGETITIVPFEFEGAPAEQWQGVTINFDPGPHTYTAEAWVQMLVAAVEGQQHAFSSEHWSAPQTAGDAS